MLHTALVISAYMSMILVPCACAQWGDVLTAEWRTMRRDLRLDLRRRREGMSEALIRSFREARAAAQIAALAKIAFVEPAPLPRIIFRARRLSLGRPRPRVRAVDALYFQRAVARVRMRLCQLSEAFRLANNIFETPFPAMAMAGASVSMASIAPPMVNFAPTRLKPPVAQPAQPATEQPAIAAQASQPEIGKDSTIKESSIKESTLEDRLTRRLFDQAGAFRRAALRPVPQAIVPKEITPSRLASLRAAIEPSPLLHFPPSPAELEALFALESPATQTQESSDAVPTAVKESSARISAAA